MKKSSHTTIYLLILKIHNRLLENTSEGKISKKKKVYIWPLRFHEEAKICHCLLCIKNYKLAVNVSHRSYPITDFLKLEGRARPGVKGESCLLSSPSCVALMTVKPVLGQ